MKKYYLKRYRYFLIISAVVLLCSCASGPKTKHKSQALYGMIYDRDNRPVSNADIYVNGKYQASSDIQGHFIISPIKPKARYAIRVVKPEWEKIETDVSFMEPSHVLYLHMFSGDQLLAEVETALGNKDWNGAEIFLSRALATGAETLPAEYLRAILARSREQYGEAHAILKTLAETEKKTPYLWLFLADLCQYYLNRPEEAGEYLAKFLALRHDADVEQRLKKLQEQAPVDKRETGVGVPEHESAGENTGDNAGGDADETTDRNAG
ncbi:MAG: carboxypeptidase regulatory-like domain-containing protein [Treponema sp.]|jgi:tetratricopeptide (TPR) repeat protein|nr:carboxypeptidase regulatory-like domain-containing protein [Treponema sp.]